MGGDSALFPGVTTGIRAMRRRWVIGVCGLLCTVWAHAAVDTVPFTLQRNRIVIYCHVNKVGPYPFMLDSGLPEIVIADDVAKYAKAKGLPDSTLEMPDSMGNMIGGDAVQIDSLKAGAIKLESGRGLAMALSGYKALIGTPIAGLVDIARFGKPVAIDFQTSQLRVGADIEATAGKYVVPLTYAADGLPVAQGVINGKVAADMILDLSYGGTVALPENWARKQGLVTSDTPRIVFEPSPENQGAVPDAQCRVQNLRIGNATLARPVCDLMPSGDRVRLGIGFLKHFHVTFDPAHKTTRLEPTGPDMPASPSIIGVGIVLTVRASDLWAVQVALRSPAAEADVHSGDLLSRIGKQSVKDMSYDDVQSKLSMGAGERIDLTFERDGESHTVTLEAEPLL